MPAQPKRRFLKLNVGEVSLVDSPANEVEFLVTKNLEEQVMGEQHETAERVVVEQPAGGESDVATVLKHVNAIVENIATVVKANDRRIHLSSHWKAPEESLRSFQSRSSLSSRRSMGVAPPPGSGVGRFSGGLCCSGIVSLMKRGG